MEDLKQKKQNKSDSYKEKKKKGEKNFLRIRTRVSLSPLFFSIEPILMMKRVASSLKKRKKKIRFDKRGEKKTGKKKWIFFFFFENGAERHRTFGRVSKWHNCVGVEKSRMRGVKFSFGFFKLPHVSFYERSP